MGCLLLLSPEIKTDTFNLIPEQVPASFWLNFWGWPLNKKPRQTSLAFPSFRGSGRLWGAVNANSFGSGSVRNANFRLLQMIDRLCWGWTGVAWVVISDSPKRLGFWIRFFWTFLVIFDIHLVWFSLIFFVILMNRLLRRCVCVLLSLERHMCVLWRFVFFRFREIYFAGEDSLF